MKEENHPYQFKALLIPDPIAETDYLCSKEQYFISVLYALETKVDGCFASNSFLAKKQKVSERRIKQMLRKFIDMELIKVEYPKKTKRIIRVDKEKFWGIKEILPVSRSKPGNSFPGKCVSLKTPPYKDIVTYTESLVAQKPATTKRDFSKKYNYKEINLKHAKIMLSNIRRINPEFKEPNLESWANEFRLFVEDGVSINRIEKMLDWIEKDEWWRGRLLSPSGLRKVSNYQTIESRMKKQEATKNEKFPIPPVKVMEDLKEYTQNCIKAGLKDCEINTYGLSIKNSDVFVHFGDPQYKEKVGSILRKQKEI